MNGEGNKEPGTRNKEPENGARSSLGGLGRARGGDEDRDQLVEFVDEVIERTRPNSVGALHDAKPVVRLSQLLRRDPTL